MNRNVDVQSLERDGERRQSPCVSSGKSPKWPRVGMPKLDIILDHQWDVFVGMSVEFDAWREERICWISLQISRYLSILERSEHDVAYTRMIRSAKLSVAMRSTGRKEIDVVSSQVAGGAKLCLRYDRHTTRHVVTLLPSRFFDQVVLRNPITTPLQPTRSFTPC